MPPRLKATRGSPSPRRTRSRSTTIAVALLAIAATLAVLLIRARSHPGAHAIPPPFSGSAPSPGEPALPAGASALLDGLRIGDRIGAWQVRAIRVLDRKLGVDLLLNERVMTVWIAQKGAHPMLPPRETERYALFFGFPPESQVAATRDLDLVLGAIEQRLRRTESVHPVPAGL
jgi:hypothetical protein